jgi:hypothetical protein
MNGNPCKTRAISRFVTSRDFLTVTFLCNPRPAYIAGVTNPIFESGGSWDVLFDVASGRVIIHKDIHANFPPAVTPAPPSLLRAGTFKAEPLATSEDEFGRLPGGKEGGVAAQKSDFVAKADSADNLFMEEVSRSMSLSPVD